MKSPTRLGILLSGRGSNFLAIQRAIERGEIPARIVLVLSNKDDAPGLDIARELGLATVAVPHRGLRRHDHDRRVAAALRAHDVEWVCLAGYMRILGPDLIASYPQRIVNIHPSLLPSFPGLDAQGQAWRHGVRVTGCTVHLVDEGLDSGPIVVQRSIEVRDGEAAEDLSERLLVEEHKAYPEALRRLFTEAWRVDGRRLCFLSKLAGAAPGAAPGEDGE